LAGVLLSLVEVLLAAPLASPLFLGRSEWFAYLAATLSLGLTLSLVATSLASLAARVSSLGAWGAVARRRRLAAVYALSAGALGVVAFHALTSGRRLVSSPLRWPIIVVAACVMALGAAGLYFAILRVRRTGGSQRFAIGLVAFSVVLLALDQHWLVRLYPALHALFALGAALALLAVTRAWPRAGWRLPLSARLRSALGLALLLIALASPLAAAYASRSLAAAPNAAYVVQRSAAFTGKLLALVPVSAPSFPGHTEATARSGRHGVDLRGQPDVLLISIDALRADRLRAYGGHGLTPEMDALGRSGAVFERAYTATPHTSYALSSLMTGKYLRPLYELGGASTDQPTLAGILRRYGYRTGAFYPPAIFFVDGARFGDFRERGFDFEYRKDMFLDARARPAQLDEWLAQVPREHPVFAWVHLFEPHEPYDPPDGYASGDSDEARYDGEVRVADEAVGALVRTFRRRRPGGTVILTADHGEEFDDHGGSYHGTTLFDEQIRVPLLWSSPGLVDPRRIHAPVELVDLPSTLLSALSIPAEVRMRGDDLGAILAGDASAGPRFAFADILSERFVTDGRLAAICSSERSACCLYDLVEDPHERQNIALERPADVSHLRAAIAGFVASVPRVEALALGSGGAWPEALAQAALGDRTQGPALTRLLGESRTEVRLGAARELGKLSYGPAAATLSRLGLEDPDPGVRAEAAIAAYHLGDETLAPALRGFTAATDDPERARRAAFALAERSDPAASATLLALALDEEASEDERLEAVRVLPDVPGPDVLEGLVALLEDVRLRTAAATSLGRLGSRAAIAPLHAALAEERYLPARGAEARALVALGDRGVLPLVRRFLGMDAPMPGGMRLMLELHALRLPGGADLRVEASPRMGAFLCEPQGCLAGDGAELRLPSARRRSEVRRLVMLVHVPAGGGVLRVGDTRHQLRAGEQQLSIGLEPGTGSTIAVRTEGELRLVAFVVVPAQDEIPPPPPEPWQDAGVAQPPAE